MSKSAPDSFGARLARAREDAGLTQADLGDRIGVGQKAVSHWETGRRAVSIDHLCRIVDALGIAASEIEPRLKAPDQGQCVV